MRSTKLLSLSGLMLGVVLLVGAGCATATDTTTNSAQSSNYENSTYGFSLVFPASWGTIVEKTETGEKIYASIQLVSENDPARYIKIQVVKNEDKSDPAVIDYPQKYITENSTYSYYYTAGTEDYPNSEVNDDLVVKQEIQDIIGTFIINEDSTEPLTYSTTGVNVSVSKTTAPFDYTAEQLKANADECGVQQEDGYFDDLVAKFSGTTKTIYSFKYLDAGQLPNTFIVTILPNLPEYNSRSEAFSHDFDICAAGGDLYPKMLNNDWLLFENSCGSGFDNGSGLPIGCQEVKDVVEPSLQLNSGTADTTTSVDIIKYEKFTAGDTGMTFDIPSGVTVTDNVNGFPGLLKFIYNGNSYLISYSEEKADSASEWASRDKSEVTVSNHDNITIYSENGFAHTAAYFLQPNPLANIAVSKQVGTSLKSDGDFSSDLDDVYQRLVASVKLDGVVVF